MDNIIVEISVISKRISNDNIIEFISNCPISEDTLYNLAEKRFKSYEEMFQHITKEEKIIGLKLTHVKYYEDRFNHYYIRKYYSLYSCKLINNLEKRKANIVTGKLV